MTAHTTPELAAFVASLLALSPGSQNGGTYANKPGYHNTRAGNAAGNYSIVDAVDKLGPADMCAAADWTFPNAQHADYQTIILYTSRLLASAKDATDPRLNVMREFYGQADQDTQVEGWDTRYGRAATSDPSHLWHIHFSFSRATVTDSRAFDAVLSVLRGQPYQPIGVTMRVFTWGGGLWVSGGDARRSIPDGGALNDIYAQGGTDAGNLSTWPAARIDKCFGPDIATLKGAKGDPGPATLVPHGHDSTIGKAVAS